MNPDGMPTNWSGNYAYRAAAIHRPSTIEQLQQLVARAERIRPLGTRHSFTAIADSAQLVSLERLPTEISIDRARATVTLSGQVTYAELAEALNGEGLALANLASLPHISVTGAVATATHGSGVALGNLATAVRGLEMVSASGALVRAAPGDESFDGLVVGLGALGVITRLTLAVEPYYEMQQRVFDDLPWASFNEHFAQITSCGESVSLFHLFGEQIDQVWVKLRSDDVRDGPRDELLGARAADGPRHPVLGGDPVNCTEQLGVPGPWSERLPHFRSGFTPSSGEEIQSEFFVAREDAVEAVTALRELADGIRPLLLVCELRTIAADTLWLSPHHGRRSVGIHFTWRRRQEEVERMVAEIERRLAEFGARPHWAKLFTARAAEIAPRYERIGDFLSLREQLDPHGKFRNDWLDSRVLGAASASRNQACHTAGPARGRSSVG